jgi:hypothetical protein
MQKHLNFSLSIVIVTLVAAAVLGLFYWQLVQENKTFDWQKFAFVHKDIEVEHEFTFDCPIGWKREDNLDYNRKVKTKQCVLNNNKPGSLSFDDGVIITFRYISRVILKQDKIFLENFNERWESMVKNFTNNKDYFNNGFAGKMSWNNNDSYFSLLARIETNNGYYEVDVTSVVSEQTKNDQEDRKVIIDQIISSFKVIK